MRLLIKGGRVLPGAGPEGLAQADVLVADDRIAAVGPDLQDPQAEVIPAHNFLLGTDGMSSNDSYNLFEVMKAAALLHNITSAEYRRWPAAGEVLRMATRGGARGTLREGEIGAIAPGMKADLVLLKLDSPRLVPLYNVVNQLVYCENGADVDTVARCSRTRA